MKLSFKRKATDRTFQYWNNIANKDLSIVMEGICDGFTHKDFSEKQDTILNYFNINLDYNYVVLDLACGIGRTCKWIAPKVKKYFGVDFVPEMINKAIEYNKEYNNAQFYVNDGKTLSIFDDKTFDIIYCEIAFQHMVKEIQKSYVSEIFRTLKIGGVFYGQIPKFEFYKDDSYALKQNEVVKLLEAFNVTWLNINRKEYNAYYLFKAEKHDDMTSQTYKI